MPRRKKEHRSLGGFSSDLRGSDGDLAPVEGAGGPGDAVDIAERIGSKSVDSSPRMEKRRTSSVRAREARPRVEGLESASPLKHLASLAEGRGGKGIPFSDDALNTRSPSRKKPNPQPPYAELHCHSNYSFKEGASHTSELLIEAQALHVSADYRVLRFWNNDVMENVEGVLERIREALVTERGSV